MFAFFGCNKAHGNPKMSTSHRQIVSVRGVLSHACLRKANWDIGMVTGFCHSPGIAEDYIKLPPIPVPRKLMVAARHGTPQTLLGNLHSLGQDMELEASRSDPNPLATYGFLGMAFRGYLETLPPCRSDIKQHSCGNETQ